MMHPTKILLFSDVFSEKVAVFFSDRSVDFILGETQSDLTSSQKEHLSQQLGVPISQTINIRQVHGDRIVIAAADDRKSKRHGPLPEADAVVTDVPHLPIAVRTADCVPVFIFDPRKNVIGLAHAGWRGSEKQIALKTVQLMGQRWGCQAEDLLVALGPSIRSCCLEVGPEFRGLFPQELSERDGKLFLDLSLANKNQLLRCGVPSKNIFDAEVCTCCDLSYFSYRREGKAAGRHLSLMFLKS